MSNANLYAQLLTLLDSGEQCLLATVARTMGSAPQKPGSSALIGPGGLIAGTIGGGYVENEVVKKAMDCLQTGTSVYQTFMLTHDIHAEAGPICGGTMEVLLDAAPYSGINSFRDMGRSLEDKTAGYLLTIVTPISGESVRISRQWISGVDKGKAVQWTASDGFISTGSPGEVNFLNVKPSDPALSGVRFLAETVDTPPHLLIAGAGHIGRALAWLGSWLGFDVTVWDDRSEYADLSLLPGAKKVFTGNFEDAIKEIPVSEKTYIVIVTRGHAGDTEVLRKMVRSGAAYIGMVGSRRKIEQMRTFFEEKGWASKEEWNRIHAPVGIDIGSTTVNEIALSIAAQMVSIRNLKKGPDG